MAARQGDEISPVLGNDGPGIAPNRHRPAVGRPIEDHTDRDRRPSVQWKDLLGWGAIARERSPCTDPSSVRRNVAYEENRLVASDRPRESRNRDSVQIPLDGAALERVDITRRTGSACGVDHMRSGQAGDFLLGTKSSRRYRWQYLTRRQRNDISPAIGNRSAGDPQRVSAGRPPYQGVTADDERRPAPERKHLDGCLSVVRTRSPCLDPTAVWRDTTQREDRLLQRLPQSRPVRPNAVHKPGGPFRVAETEFAGGAKVRPPPLHPGDLRGRGAPVKRPQPQPRLPFRIRSLQYHLPAVRGDLVVEHGKAGRQGLGAPGVQVCHPHFAGISIRSDQPWNRLDNPVAKLFTIRRE